VRKACPTAGFAIMGDQGVFVDETTLMAALCICTNQEQDGKKHRRCHLLEDQ
jgi:hypothetical protein